MAAVATDVFEAKDFSDLTHWQSLAGMALPDSLGKDRALGE